ncbi:hypothetical protein B0H14DRAFT_3746965 [Mycena olivaceomarginata]|nr:hypothetical protein B0H14DRAFT_3746965 [Mycena olivaceomarginata]
MATPTDIAVAQHTYPFKIEYITTLVHAEDRLQGVEPGMAIGLDAEWKAENEPGTKRKTRGERNEEQRHQAATVLTFVVSWEHTKLRTVQIYFGNGTVYILDLPAMKGIPRELIRICTSKDIIKVGTGIHGDAGRMWKDFRIDVLSCLELGLACKIVYPEDLKPRALYSELVSLADIAKYVCGMELDKSQSESDWSKPVLTPEQLLYAAKDAYASFECYKRLQQEIEGSEHHISRNWYTFDVVGNVRMEVGTTVKWKADCVWWSKDPGVGFVARRVKCGCAICEGRKGQPAFKPATKGRLVSPAVRPEKKNFDLEVWVNLQSTDDQICVPANYNMELGLYLLRGTTRTEEKRVMSNTPAAQEASTEPEIVLDAEQYAICPDCKERVHCGPSGIQNLLKRHRGKGPCKEAQAKKAKKSLKDSQISAFFRPKPTPIPSTVVAPAPVRVFAKSAPAPVVPLPLNRSRPFSEPPRPRFTPGSLLGRLEAAIKILPPTVQEATDSDALAAFGRDPSQYVDAEVPALEVFEHLNPIFHTTLGWAMPVEETAQLLRRGVMGVDGLLRFIAYFVEERGVREQDFAAKIEQIIDAIHFLTQNSDSELSAIRFEDHSAPGETFIDADLITHDTDSPVPDTRLEGPSAPRALEDDADGIEIIAYNPAPKPFHPCEGFIYPLREGQTFSTAYSLLLHDKWNLPWDYGVRRGVVYLTAHTCTKESRPGQKNCAPCANLSKSSILKGMISRSEEGVHENAHLMYHPPAALVEIVRKKNTLIQNLRLGLLTSSRNLLTQTGTLSDYKRFVVAIGSGKVQRVDRVVRACIKQKRGIRGMIETFVRAQKGLYNPAKSEEDDMIGVAVLKLAGVRVAEIVHRALGLPGVTTLRNRMITPPLTASPGAPEVQEIEKNIEACFAGIMEALTSKKVVHLIVMIDEIALEKRIRWDPRTNYFLGLCREHAHNVGLQFNGEGDLDELMNALEKKIDAEGKESSLVHNAAEATVAAVGIMSEDTRLYSARPILVSGDCKRESGSEHAKSVLNPVLRALETKKDLTRLRTICLASDGETRRGAAFMIKTWKRKLSPTSNIYPLLKDLQFMNFMVGDDDLTGDKDPKHVDKRWRNSIIRDRGIRVLGIDLKPGIIRTHLQSVGHTADHIRSAFNPEDKQNVKLAFDLLKDIWTLPPCPLGTNPGIAAAREALRTLGKLLYHFVSPYICVDFSLSEQLEHLSAAAHLALALFRRDGKHFMASLLYTDIMIIIKNVYFCVAKTKVDDPMGKFWLILLGTDRLEELFGILRTMIGNDANCDMLQILDRLRGTTEVSTILTKYPHWDRAPRRLRLPAMTRDSKELSDHVDHIKPASVRGDMRVQEVTLLTSWKRGRRLVEAECPWAVDVLASLEGMPDINILAPHGKDSFADLDEDDNEDDETPVPIGCAVPPHPLSTDIEDAAEEELQATDVAPELRTPITISHSITVDGREIRKARALSQRLKYGNKKVSTDRNRRVAGVARHSDASVLNSGFTEFDSVFGGPSLMISDVIATLVRCEGRTFLCLGEVNGIYLNSESLDSIGLDVLPERTVNVSFQFLKIIPSTTADDISSKHDWKSAGLLERTLKVPGQMVQPLNPTLSTVQSGNACYLFESNGLRILTASLFEPLTPQKRLLIPEVSSSKFYPYREGAGRACFVCEVGDNSRELDAAHTCPACPPNTPLDPGQGQQVLGHMAAHILYDPKIDKSSQPCGLCLNPAPMCEFHLTMTGGKPKLNIARSKCPSAGIKFRYSTAAQSTPSSPSSNVPINCTLCGTGQPAIWRYNYLEHLRTVHPSAPTEKYASIWQLKPDELKNVKNIWLAADKGVPIPKKRQSKTKPLTISEAHSSRLSMNSEKSVSFINDSDLPKLPVDSDEDSAVETGDERDEERDQHDEEMDMGLGDNLVVDLDVPTVAITAAEEIDVRISDSLNIVSTSEASLPPSMAADPSISSSTETTAPSGGNPTVAVVSPLPPVLGRGKRKRKARNFGDLKDCLCGIPASGSDGDAIECNRNGCETGWYHLLCVGMESAVTYWTCGACASSGSSSRAVKRARRD